MNFKESLRSAKDDFRRLRIEAGGEKKCLDNNCVVYCDRPFEGVLELHITQGFTRQVLREVHTNLIEIVKNDVHIQKIKMVSPVVLEHQNLMERFGFEVNTSLSEKSKAEISAALPKNMQGKPFIEMQISREKFLEMNKITISDTLDKKL
ncbi:MAG: hypothetical protein KBD55_01190 [Candidatus Pacebacteria bacterium]|nr:hypothetical protein [Candidatus Paceibacterota bacterium]